MTTMYGKVTIIPEADGGSYTTTVDDPNLERLLLGGWRVFKAWTVYVDGQGHPWVLQGVMPTGTASRQTDWTALWTTAGYAIHRKLPIDSLTDHDEALAYAANHPPTWKDML